MVSKSVGQNGVNLKEDVVLTQRLLKGKGIDPGPVDGRCGRRTIDAIVRFQSRFLARPDGRIDPNGATWRRLHGSGGADATPTFVLLPQMCGLGYYPYSASDRQYGTQETIDLVVQIGRDWLRNMQSQFGVGDMSFIHGGAMQPHASHNKGTTVDIRPIRKDRLAAPVNIHMNEYDSDATALLIAAFLAHRNVKRVLFNDSRIAGVRQYAGHDNHFHVQTRR